MRKRDPVHLGVPGVALVNGLELLYVHRFGKRALDYYHFQVACGLAHRPAATLSRDRGFGQLGGQLGDRRSDLGGHRLLWPLARSREGTTTSEVLQAVRVSRGLTGDWLALKIPAPKMPFTILCHPTAFGQTKGAIGAVHDVLRRMVFEREVISDLAENIDGRPARLSTTCDFAVQPGDYLVLDGPGNPSAPPGTTNPYRRYAPLAARERARVIAEAQQRMQSAARDKPGAGELAAEFLGQTMPTSLAAGLFLGSGWEWNTRLAVEVIQALKFDRQWRTIDRVNMVGWSRGAVTCIMIAHRLAEIFPSLPVAIFAIDPVAGSTPLLPQWLQEYLGSQAYRPELRVIPANVDHYMAVVARDEISACLESTVATAGPGFCGTREVIKIPGTHLLPGAVRASGRLNEVSELCLHLAHSFLSRYQTRFRPTFNPTKSPAELCRLYALMLTLEIEYRRYNYLYLRALFTRDAPVVVLGTLMRIIGGHRPLRPRGHRPRIFVNHHHRHCFWHAFPHLRAEVQKYEQGGPSEALVAAIQRDGRALLLDDDTAAIAASAAMGA
jgi:hypothetical protein